MTKRAAKEVTDATITFLLFSFASLLVFLSLLLTSLYLNDNEAQKVLGMSTSAEQERLGLEKILQTYPHYYPAWKKLAEIEHLVGNETAAKGALKRAWEINPLE